MINLYVRNSTAYFDCAKFGIADNEKLVVKLCDGGNLENAYLVVNEKVFAFHEGIIELSPTDLAEVNCCELQDRNSDGTIKKHYTTESLCVYALSAERELGNERAVYLAYIQQLEKLTQTLAEQVNLAHKRITSLEQGKFTVFNFKGE